MPHLHPENAVFFITYRIAGSLPKNILDEYQYEKENDLLEDNFFTKFDNYLDKQKGVLTQPEIAKVIVESLMFNHKKSYNLIAYCIMPNHIHFIINTNNYPYKNLFMLLKSIKGYSANLINKITNRKGQFWHHESYDHIINSKIELGNTISYVINNPVKSGLVQNWKDWNYTYVDEKYIDE